jgi:K+-transporting ATPase ATPase C chain
MLRELRASAVAVVALTLVLGLALPAIVTGFAQVAFAHQANGSLIAVDRRVVGSTLAAQSFSQARYFHERPSATVPAYDAAATTFSNLGPTSRVLARQVAQRAKAILALEGPYNPGLTVHRIPVDAVTTSGSGIDPDISPAYAQLQSRRVAAVRRLPIATVRRLIAQSMDGRSLGFFGEPGVNVLKLNLALDREQST